MDTKIIFLTFETEKKKYFDFIKLNLKYFSSKKDKIICRRQFGHADRLGKKIIFE